MVSETWEMSIFVADQLQSSLIERLTWAYFVLLSPKGRKCWTSRLSLLMLCDKQLLYFKWLPSEASGGLEREALWVQMSDVKITSTFSNILQITKEKSPKLNWFILEIVLHEHLKRMSFWINRKYEQSYFKLSCRKRPGCLKCSILGQQQMFVILLYLISLSVCIGSFQTPIAQG